ncbi:MAG: CrcB family protein [Hyphomonadaceae bacterium]|nr:CrcB family protein [Hyphomonadaceae bacterium]
MRDFLLVAMGGALGAAARYGVTLAAARCWGQAAPWGTLIVNVAGGFAMGLLAGLAGDRRDLMLVLGAGVLGGFTTFSAFSIEMVRMIERGEMGLAALYLAASVTLAVGAAFAGLMTARGLA